MYGDPALWDDLLRAAGPDPGAFLRVQALAGASAVQLFDSWVGALPLADYERYVRPHSAAALAAVADLDVPRIHFGVGTGELLGAMGSAGAEVVGVDFRVSLDEAVRRLGPGYAVQGNLDPATAVRALAGDRAAGPPDRRRGTSGARPRLQPRSRRAARHRPGGADPGGRAGPRGVHALTEGGRAPPANAATPAFPGGSAGSGSLGFPLAPTRLPRRVPRQAHHPRIRSRRRIRMGAMPGTSRRRRDRPRGLGSRSGPEPPAGPGPPSGPAGPAGGAHVAYPPWGGRWAVRRRRHHRRGTATIASRMTNGRTAPSTVSTPLLAPRNAFQPDLSPRGTRSCPPQRPRRSPP